MLKCANTSREVVHSMWPVERNECLSRKLKMVESKSMLLPAVKREVTEMRNDYER